MLILYHLTPSPYSEKARWALDYKGLEWESELLFPGQHARTVKRIAGTTTVPMLVDSDSDTKVTDSTDILQYLENIAPEPPLFPEDPDARRRVLEIEDFLDEHCARAVSRLNYTYMLDYPPVFIALMNKGLSSRQKTIARMLRPVFPLIARRFRRSRQLNREAAKGHRKAVFDVCERLEGWLDESGGEYLVGERFSAADLTAVSLLGPAVQPPGSPWDLSGELDRYPDGFPPPDYASYRRELEARPIYEWVLRMWERHRSGGPT